MSRSITTAARLSGLAAGCVLAVVAVSLARVDDARTDRGARLAVAAAAAPGAAVSPSGPVLVASGLEPSQAKQALHAGLSFENKGRRRSRMTLAVPGRTSALDGFMRVEIGVRGRRIFRGTLRRLRREGSSDFVVRARSRAPADIRMWLPEELKRRGFRGRSARVTLELRRAG